MKLIDLDELQEYCWEYPGDIESITMELRNIPTLLSTFPTIEAIPISWIEKRIAKSKEYPNSDDISDCYSLKISEVWGWLLEDWKEENGTN